MAERLQQAKAEEEEADRDPPFMMLSAAQKIFGLAERCRATRKMGLLCTSFGVGKTMAITAYADQHRLSCVLITAFQGMTSKRLLQDLARRYALDWKGSSADMFRPIVAKLRTSGHPLIIIDECDYLGTARDTVRQLHDQAECGVLLAGTEQFSVVLKRRSRGTEGQFLSRIAFRLDIDRIVEEDGQQLAGFFGVSSAASQRAWDLSSANARRLVTLLGLATDLAAGGAVEVVHVAQAAKILPPVEFAT